jgi:ribosomal protein S26
MEIQVAQKRKLVEGDHIRVKDCEPSALWEVYAVHKVGRKVRYSVNRLEKVEEK